MIIEKSRKRIVAGELQSSKGYVRRQKFTNPVVAGNTGIKSAVTLTAALQTVLAAALTQPDFARTIRFKGNGTGTQGLVVTINGTDIRGKAITEAVTMGGSYGTPTDSTLAFKTITSIVFPIESGGSTISVGPGAQLGLDRIVSEDSAFYGTVDTVIDTRPVITDAATLAGCTVLFSTSLANNKVFVVSYIATEITGDAHTTA